MSPVGKSDVELDLRLKRRMMRYLWSLGYVPRRNVDLTELWEGGSQHTDIDVLGVKIDEDLTSRFIICDCKSGVKAKTRERLFWLSGVMKYFGSERGFFLRTQLLSPKYLDLANRLGITPLSSEQLLELETSYDIATKRMFGAFSDSSEKAGEIFSLLGRYERKVGNYILRAYWEDSPDAQIASIISCCKRIKEIRDLSEVARSFLLSYCFSQLALSLLRFSKDILVVPKEARDERIKSSLLGGKMKVEERRNLLVSFHSFMTREIKERYSVDYPISASQLIENLNPPYGKYVADLVIRICNNPRLAILMPRLFDILAFDVTLSGDKLDPNRVLGEYQATDHDSALKPARDFLSFADRSGITTEHLLKTFEDSLIPPRAQNALQEAKKFA